MKLHHICVSLSGLAAVTLLSNPCLAQAPVSTVAPHASPPIERALDSIDADLIATDLYFMADDEMRGRNTVSQEQRIAARYIKARMQRLGFEPGAGDSFLYEYPLVGKTLERSKLAATLTIGDTARELAYGSDYTIAGRWAVADIENVGDIVYCGGGSKSEVEAAGVEGKWALCHYESGSVWRASSPASRAGAVGTILISTDGAEIGSVVPHFNATNTSVFDSRVSWPASGEQRRAWTPFPILALSDDLSAVLLADAPAIGTTLNAKLEAKRGMSEEPVAAENVCALWPGSDPQLKDEIIIISAHYDHVGASGGEIYNGADDNGSGTCGMLALAEALVEYGPMRRSVMLIWVSGEEKGLWGSRAWAQNPSLSEGQRAVANINIDMIGRNAPNVLYVTPSQKHDSYNGLTRLMEQFGAEEGFGNFPEGKKQGFDGLGSADDYYGRSDHAEFAKLDIPVCFLFAGTHEDYHRATDTVEKIDFDKIERVVRLVVKALDAMQGDDLGL